MIAELGQYCLILALMIAVAQSVVPLVGAWRRDINLLVFANYAAVAQFLFIGSAFALLTMSFVTSDFSVTIVAIHSNTSMPFFFRLAATWGNHEGSLLLWILVLATFGASIALFGRNLPATLKARVLAVQASIAAGFLALTVFTSNPFARLHPAPSDGQELNPLLQDIGLVIHPPFLYLGYVGFSVAFSFAVAALMEGRVDAAWARYVRPWVLGAWICLTIGIALGSFWAYYELGWGGWWFWDPVENASFMPWLAGTALLHSAIVVERRQALIVWTLFLAILTFSLSLVGTFLVRSGVLTSVHAFASDPTRGIGVLLLLSIFTGGALTLYAFRARTIDRVSPFSTVSREGGLILNNILLVVGTGTVFLGTFYPLLVELFGPDKISVGAPFYNRSFVPMMIPLLIAVVFGPALHWKRDKFSETLRRLKGAIIATSLVTVVLIITLGFKNFAAILGLALGAWLVFGSVTILVRRTRLFDRKFGRSFSLAKSTPRSTYGMIVAHAGLGLFVAGVTCVTAWEQERIQALAPGDSIAIAGYTFTLEGIQGGVGPNFQYERGSFLVEKGDTQITRMTSERRFYPVSNRVTTEAAISPRGLTNLYVALGEPNDRGAWVARIYYHPGVLLIWIGPALMAFGGFLSLTDRRMRIGAPRTRSPLLSATVKASA